MLKEKREKGATTPSSPHDATPPATPPTVKEERKEDEGVTPSPKPPTTPQKKSDDDDGDKVTPADGVETSEQPPFSGGSGSIQPLVSNLMGKQSGGLEYMQQSSQIFVFSTTLANKGAESVLNGHFPSIIAYHCAQPGTKKILEKHPLKLGQFNRHAPWSLMSAFSQKPRTKAPPGGLMETPDTDTDSDGWPPESLKTELTDEMANGGSNVSPAAASLVQGVKVPDENLTPQQRQHREEQLAMIRKMHLMLFPEQSDADAATMQDVEEKLANEMANRQMAHMADFLPCPTPMAAPGYKGGGAGPPDWTRLQHHYCEERKGGGRGAPQRAHGPPPPYHQTPRSASVPIATHSPSPNSPQNLTSTLSLPSPRGGGGGALASPSDSRHVPMRHLSAGQSPASAGSPAALSRPLAQSSPATPQSAHLSPCGGAFKDVDLPPPDDKAQPPPSSPARTPSRGDGGALKVEHAPSPGITCSPASQTQSHDKAATFFADISPEGSAGEHVNMGGGGGGNFSLADDNMPLNPDTSVAPETTKVMPFDPISSLAQMSQQLTNTTPPFNGAPPPNGGVMATQISTCSYGQEMSVQQQQHTDEMLECAQLHGMMVSATDMVGLHSAPYGKILPPTAGKPLSPKMVTGGVHGVGGFGVGGQMARMGSPAGRLCPPASLADSYNGGASVQVRASAPNTIQYLPARPQLCPQMPRPPPSLDFLQRFANPMHNGDGRRHDMMNGVFHEHPGGGPPGMFQGGGGPPLRHAPPFHSPDKLMEPPPPTSQSYVGGGPTTTDPNYAQQFHNFQQQLYATTTRISTTQGGAPPQTYFINK